MVVNVINEENIKGNKDIFLKKPEFLLPHLQKKGENTVLLSKLSANQTNVDVKVHDVSLHDVSLHKEGQKKTGIRRKKKLSLNWGRDIFFQSVWLNKLQNRLMRHGKKGAAEKILLRMMTILNQQGKGNAFLIFHQALNQIRPVLTVVPRRVGRRIYQVPVPLERKKQYKLALKWLTGISRNKKKTGAVGEHFGGYKGAGKTAEILATELINTVFLKRSECLKKKKELYDVVVKNRAYSHYRWI